mgnify:CR=1 FL=1
MKACNVCGEECCTKEGVNRCVKCKQSTAKARSENKKRLETALTSLGLTKVKGALGGTYWE